MSLSFLTKPIGGSKKDKDADQPARAERADRGRESGPVRGGATSVAVGGSPRVDLMPPEIRVKRSQLHTRRSLRLGLLAVFVLVSVACAGTWIWGGVAQTSLLSAQAQQQALVAEQSKYSDVTTVKESIALIRSGQIVGDSSEINWQSYLTKLQATLPAGVTLSTVAVDSATPLKAYEQTTTPLQGGRIATLQFTATSDALPSIPLWLVGLRTLPGFVDATPGTVTLTDSGYLANVVMHINSGALANRFDTKAAKSAATTGSNEGGN